MLHQSIDMEVAEREAWSLRRQKGIPNNRRLFVLACMDERLPVEQALGIRLLQHARDHHRQSHGMRHDVRHN